MDKNIDNILVSILMPIYNSEKYLQKCLNSILSQTHVNLEIICVDDCSTDGSAKILKKAAKRDKRIVTIRNKTNLGIARSLNKAIAVSKGKYLARMDSDDVSLKRRIEVQLRFMENNHDVDVLGSSSYSLTKYGYFSKNMTFSSDAELKVQMLFENPFIHPTVMFRAHSLRNFGNIYDENEKAEDYKLWTVLANNLQFANIPEPLIWYRVNDMSYSHTSSSAQTKSFLRERMNYCDKSGLNIDQNLHRLIIERTPNLSSDLLEKLLSYLSELSSQNISKKSFEASAFLNVIDYYMFRVSVRSVSLKRGRFVYKSFVAKSQRHSFYKWYFQHMKLKIKFWLGHF